MPGAALPVEGRALILTPAPVLRAQVQDDRLLIPEGRPAGAVAAVVPLGVASVLVAGAGLVCLQPAMARTSRAGMRMWRRIGNRPVGKHRV